MTRENRNRKKPELLLPAGSMETLQTAVRYGADAVYLGGKNFSLRARAHNFSAEAMAEAIAWAHGRDVRVYVTVNVFAREAELAEAAAFFRELSAFPEKARPDALLIADPGMLMLAKEHCPAVPLHLSTQANTTNAASCCFWHAAGVARIVLARELSLSEIRCIRAAVPETLSLECFVHGAMCISYAGRCLLSRALTGRDANRGACAHPCRYRYALVEEKRPGVYFPIGEDAQGTEILASDDLCMLAHIPALTDAGIDSFKIEGRMKNALYVAGAARAYRCAIDLLWESEATYRAALPSLLDEVRTAATRPMSTGFYFGDQRFGNAGDDGGAVADVACEESSIMPSERPRVFLGVVREVRADGAFFIEQRNRFAVGEELWAMKPCGQKSASAGVPKRCTDSDALFADVRLRVVAMENEDGTPVQSAAHPKERLWVQTEPLCGAKKDAAPSVPDTALSVVEAGDVLYRQSFLGNR